MAKKVQLMSNPKQWQTINGEQVLVDVEQHDLDPITDSSCVEIEGYRTLEETISQENMFTPEIVETKVHSKVGGVYHDNVVDGAYEEAILYGNTQVNLVESITTSAKYIPHTFTSFQKNEQKISVFNSASGYTNQVAPLMKGATMVNLAQTTSKSLEPSNGLFILNIKPNTEYTLSLTYTVKNIQASLIIQSYKDDVHLENSMIKAGLDTQVKFVFTTHTEANRIRICNPNSQEETIQLDNIMLIEGDLMNMEIPFFKGMRSVELVKPLTNLFTDSMTGWGNNATCTNSGGQVVVTSSSVATWTARSFTIPTLKPNTQYLVMWDSLSYTYTSSNTNTTIAVYNVVDGKSTCMASINNNSKCPTVRSLVFDTTGYETSNIQLRIHATTSNSETGTTTVTGLRVFEWDDSLRSVDLQTIGYFSGTKYVCQHVFKTESKNLYPYGDINFTTDHVGWCDAKGKINMYGDIAQKSSTRFLLKKGTYTFSVGSTTNIDPIYLVDDKEQQVSDLSTNNKTFTLTQDTYCTIRVKTIEANVATTATNIQIERGETATTYQGYDGRAYIPDCKDEIILRSLPNGVCDTFNLQTGEYIQRVGEVVLDGSEDEGWFLATSGDKQYYATNSFSNVKNLTDGGNQTTTCDKLGTPPIGTPTIYKYVLTSLVGMSGFAFSLDWSMSLGEAVLWLQENPITVQYELDKPIVKTLPVAKQIYNVAEKNVVSMSNNLGAFTCYKTVNNFMMVGNLSPIPTIVEPITSLPYNVRLKENTNYTLKYNRGNSSSMTFDLGGTSVTQSTTVDGNSVQEELLIKTPKYALTHNQLILTGNGYAYNFVIVEGDMGGKELPYFEGMKNVKMPIVKNIGKNLFDIQSIYQELKNIAPDNVLLLNDNTLRIKSTGNWHKKDLGKPIKFKKNTRYTLSFNAQDIDNTEKPDTIICFVYTDGTTSYSRVWGDNVCISTVGKTVDYINFSFGHGDGRMAEFSNFMLVEGTETQPYVPYKENSVYAVQGEIPITSEMFEQGGFSTGNGKYTTYETMKYGEENASYLKRLRSKDLIPVKPNTTYAFAHSFSKFAYNVYQWNGNREFMDGTSQYFAYGQVETITTTADTQYIHFLMSKHETSQAITVSEYDWSQFHMYELDSTINLRSLPNGVKDELNLLTGEYIQRVGEVVVDGSGDYTEHIHESSTHYGFRVPVTLKPKAQQYETYPRPIICDKLPSINYGSYFNGVEEGVSMYVGESITISNIYLSFDRNRINMPQENNSIDYVKKYCQTNPLTVQYELAEPITSHVRLVSNNQEREVGVKLPNGVCNTYNPSTGITTVRVGKVVLDGSESWYFSTTKTNTQVFGLTMSDIAMTQNNLYCETMRVASGIDAEIIATVGGDLFIALLKTKASTVEELKTYLASNPVTVWYELKYPQIQPDIVLPNGVHDEYNPETGVYTKKVGFIEFDGSADELWHEPFDKSNSSPSVYNMWTLDPLPNVKLAPNGGRIPGVCDSLKFHNNFLGESDFEMYFISTTGRFNFNIERAKLSSGDSAGLNQYLSQNPIKLWYELQTPITYQLTPYFGLPQPYAYEDGYLIHDSAYAETTLPPEFKYKLVANRTGQVMQNNRKLQEHTTRLSDLEALIIEATIESIFNRELQLFELELMDIQLIDLGE